MYVCDSNMATFREKRSLHHPTVLGIGKITKVFKETGRVTTGFRPKHDRNLLSFS